MYSYYAELSSCCIASTDYHINMSAIVATQGSGVVSFILKGQESLELKSSKIFVSILKEETMKFIPAIDILGGRCVRLLKGNYNHTDFGN